MWVSPAPPPACRRASKFSAPWRGCGPWPGRSLLRSGAHRAPYRARRPLAPHARGRLLPRTGPAGPLCGAPLPAVWVSPAPPPACRRASKFSAPWRGCGPWPGRSLLRSGAHRAPYRARRPLAPHARGRLLPRTGPAGPLCGAPLPAVWVSPAPPPACRRASKFSAPWRGCGPWPGRSLLRSGAHRALVLKLLSTFSHIFFLWRQGPDGFPSGLCPVYRQIWQ